ncbi:trans-aconitate 2-methyltransferase [Streptomyces sp. WAC06614]|uniref:trans-aconitate 2-methyltransferase n=1 Tax=Streptomyces sp. WAC06614 TaxID=2487416 RepID=UPI000F78A011|nr:trans-aconitate 2-methyltransferase [Streptomyces sp. WAC06614]RSS72288.1 trans-aconitate 2-methyltransferase [Streptomyces sp. WAC06614]
MHSDAAPAVRPLTATEGPTPSAPTWDPQQYLRHAGHRTRPFVDLLARIPELPAPAPRIADLGCGPGNVTALLADRWAKARITGYDLSPEMLERATAEYAGATPGGGSLDFRPADIASWLPEEPFDLIVSNAALQWVPSHPASFAAWIHGLRPGGTFAFQIPGNFQAPSHSLLAALCDTPRWRPRLAGLGARYVHLLEPGEYLARLTELGCTVEVWETTYYQLLTGPDPVLDWVKGTALRPVLTALGDDHEAASDFLLQYRDLLRGAYPPGPRGTVFPFRRVFAVARKEN